MLDELARSADIATRLAYLRTKNETDDKPTPDQVLLVALADLATAHLNAGMALEAAEELLRTHPGPTAEKEHREARGARQQTGALLKAALGAPPDGGS